MEERHDQACGLDYRWHGRARRDHQHQDGGRRLQCGLPQIPISRLGKPEEVAGLIIYLCSDEAAFVTGANIAINGGQHMQ